MQEKKYGLLTSITMIAGIVIGSGIFFKSDDVLRYTNGNMLLGIIVFAIAAIAIIFGSLSIAQLAARTDTPGGIIGYAEHFVNRKTAGAIGWFQMFLYFPTLIGVVSWVTGLYLCQLFHLKPTPLTSTVLGGIILIGIFVMNALSAMLGGIFQNAAMFIKLVPLIIIAVVGLFMGDTSQIIAQDINGFQETIVSSSWMAAFAPIAFSYDGWSVATTICHEIKNSKRNLPIAMTIAPLAVLACYLFYFVGITSLVGVQTVMEQGNDSVYIAANQIFGTIGAKLILIFVIISVLGTLNGLVLAYIQLPYSLSIRSMLPKKDYWMKPSKHFGQMPIRSAMLAFFISFIWIVINYVTQAASISGDVSEVPVTLSYCMFTVLYVVVIRLKKQGQIKSWFMGYVVPILAIFGSIIIIGGTVGHPSFWIFTILAVLVCGCGYLYNKN